LGDRQAAGLDPDQLGDFKKLIIRSLGPDPEVEVDIEGPHPWQPGDAYLLAATASERGQSPDEIGAVVTTLSPDEAVGSSLTWQTSAAARTTSPS